MRYYRCKCGRTESWGSMSPKACVTCDRCGNTLASAPDLHRVPIPHDYIAKYDEDTGQPYEICQRCLRRKGEVTSVVTKSQPLDVVAEFFMPDDDDIDALDIAK